MFVQMIYLFIRHTIQQQTINIEVTTLQKLSYEYNRTGIDKWIEKDITLTIV